MLRKLFADNSSLLVLLLGAASNFLLILFVQKDFPEIFVPLSLYLTYIGIVGGLGFLGFDQVYLRLATIGKAKSSIQTKVFLSMMLLLLLVPLAFASYFSRYEHLSFMPLYISGVSINAIMLGYNANRLQKSFSIAQVFKNSYKVLLLLGAWLSLMVIQPEISISTLFYYASLLLLSCGIVAFISFCFKTQVVVNTNTKIFFLAISFGLNIALITALGYGERVLIMHKIDEQTFAIYFYYLTVFLFPLTLLQEYVGFKELVFFKERIDKREVFTKVIRLIGLGVLTYALIILVIYIDANRFLRVDLEKDYLLIAWMSILGLVKLVYGLFSAILGAKGESKSIGLINLITFLILVGLWLFMHLTGYSLKAILISLILVFLYRSTHTYLLYVR